jgi:hypothetical protein
MIALPACSQKPFGNERFFVLASGSGSERFLPWLQLRQRPVGVQKSHVGFYLAETRALFLSM